MPLLVKLPATWTLPQSKLSLETAHGMLSLPKANLKTVLELTILICNLYVQLSKVQVIFHLSASAIDQLKWLV